MVKYGVLFEVRAEFLNTIYTSFGFKGLISFVTTFLWRSQPLSHGNMKEGPQCNFRTGRKNRQLRLCSWHNDISHCTTSATNSAIFGWLHASLSPLLGRHSGYPAYRTVVQWTLRHPPARPLSYFAPRTKNRRYSSFFHVTVNESITIGSNGQSRGSKTIFDLPLLDDDCQEDQREDGWRP
jgi:hypothetical protein